MGFVAVLKLVLAGVVRAVGEVFAWLNRREARKDADEVRERVSENLAAAARPDRESADRLNAWLARGFSGRLRRGDGRDADGGAGGMPDGP